MKAGCHPLEGSWRAIAVLCVAWPAAVTGCGTSEAEDQRSAWAAVDGGAPRVEPAVLRTSPTATARDGGAEGAAGALELPGRATLDEVVRLLAEVEGTSVELTPATEGVARCLRLILEPGVVSPEVASRRLRAALAAPPLVLDGVGDGSPRVGVDPELLFVACAPLGEVSGLGQDELDRLRRTVRQLSETEREVPGAALRALPRLGRGGPEEARLVPYYREEQLLGLKVYTGRSGSLLELLGWREGDLITHAAGQALTDRGVALRLPAVGGEILFRLLRGSAPLELRYRLVPEEGGPR